MNRTASHDPEDFDASPEGWHNVSNNPIPNPDNWWLSEDWILSPFTIKSQYWYNSIDFHTCIYSFLFIYTVCFFFIALKVFVNLTYLYLSEIFYTNKAGVVY